MRGRAVDLLSPTADDIDPVELSILAGRLNRFGGHTRTPYTVADHSWRVARECPDALMLAGLLHDAHEAYYGADISQPLKALIETYGNVLAVVENAWDRAIAERFGLDPSAFHSPEVKRADLALLATEKRDLMQPAPMPWRELPDALPDRIVPMRNSGAQFARLLSELSREPIDLGLVRDGLFSREPRNGVAGLADRQHETCISAPPLGPVTA